MAKFKTTDLFLVVPKLIEQPTWGGRYILRMKGWSKKKLFEGLIIGQSYELYSQTVLRNDLKTTAHPAYTGQLGLAMEPDKIQYQGAKEKLITLQKLINLEPQKVLGKVGSKRFGAKMQVLIKLTQAKGNSFQLHVREKDQSKKWVFKPESWYYFEPGILTLGIKKGAKIRAYKKACQEIDRQMKIIVRQIRAKKIALDEGKRLAQVLIKKINPWQYVNLIGVKKDEIVDLSSGGLHHSWEEDPKLPLGNIVYELCFDVMDPVSVLRAFDKGKIKSDGSLRQLTIAEYFKYLDTTEKTNNPQTHLSKGTLLKDTQGFRLYKLLRTKYYCLDKMVFAPQVQQEIVTQESFHHLFVKQGKIKVRAGGQELTIGRGHSGFIPAGVGAYTVESLKNQSSQVLKTFIS